MTAIWIVQVLEVDRSSDPDGSCRMRLRLIRDYPDAVLPQSFHFFVLLLHPKGSTWESTPNKTRPRVVDCALNKRVHVLFILVSL